MTVAGLGGRKLELRKRRSLRFAKTEAGVLGEIKNEARPPRLGLGFCVKTW